MKVSYEYLGSKACCPWIAMVIVASKLNDLTTSRPCFYGVSVEICIQIMCFLCMLSCLYIVCYCLNVIVCSLEMSTAGQYLCHL